MTIRRFKTLLIVCLLLPRLPLPQRSSLVAGPQATSVRPSQELLGKLAPQLRDRGAELLNQSDEKSRARLAGNLARIDPAATMEFLLAVLDTETSPLVRQRIVDRLGRHSHARIREALERFATSDPDATVSLAALEGLRMQRTEEMRQLLWKRMELARANGDGAVSSQLAREDQRWTSLVRGTMLPSFMQAPPPLFSLKATDQPIRVLAFGDFGNGSLEQKEVAAAMQRYHREQPFDFAITLGDNFYSLGMESPADPRWKSWWDELYDPLGIKFYASLGNHDWGFSDSPAAEVLYTQQSPTWRLPATYYSFTAGAVQFFALDTNEIPEAQLVWLKQELAKSRAIWKLVYGHHPIYSAGVHEDNPRLVKQLMPVLKDRADIFFAGHDHDLQHLKTEGGVHFFVSGGGGAGIRQPLPGPRSLFAKGVHGFSVLEADPQQFIVRFFDRNLSLLYEYILKQSIP
ncbi:MAG: metallophosphoesterase [Acidobacteria bacterium]|nr:metallophosphoesterase [Acidobacteriota bacterium]MCI0723714.1 metallophosphoesterase [Acidobacteriota bacterium]